MSKKNKQMMATATGVVVGAGAVIAGAVALSKKENRDKVKKVFAKGQEMVKGYRDEVTRRSEEVKGDLEKNISKGKNDLRKTADKILDKTLSSAKSAKKQVGKLK